MVDVAREAGVALRTVSRVVNDDPTVGAGLAARVRAAIAAMGYQPDEGARRLRSGVSGTLGAAVRKLAEANPVLSAIERAATGRGRSVLASSTEDDEKREREVVMSICRRRVDGVVVEPIGDAHQYLESEIAAGMPIVAVDRPMGGVSVDTVLSDNAAGIGIAFRHLTLHGHRRIAYVGDQERIFTGRERAAAFRACVAASGESVAGMVHPGVIEPARIAAALRAALHGPSPATALVTGNLDTTVEVLRQLGADAGRRIAIVAFDDFALADLLGLTVVAQDANAIGSTAVDLLLARGAEPDRPVQSVTVPVTLITRGSGELAAAPALQPGY